MIGRRLIAAIALAAVAVLGGACEVDPDAPGVEDDFMDDMDVEVPDEPGT